MVDDSAFRKDLTEMINRVYDTELKVENLVNYNPSKKLKPKKGEKLYNAGGFYAIYKEK